MTVLITCMDFTQRCVEADEELAHEIKINLEDKKRFPLVKRVELFAKNKPQGLDYILTDNLKT